MKQDQKITILKDDVYKKKHLNINKVSFWEFVTYDVDSRINYTSILSDFQYTRKIRIQENTFDLGWNFDMAHRVYGISRHTKLHKNFALANLKISLAGSNPDNKIWNSAYDGEIDGLQGLEVFTEITTAEYLEYVRKHDDAAQAIPTMNLFTIKPDINEDPTQAKSRIIVLGNLEKQIWSQENRYTPVLSAPTARLLTSMAVGDGRQLKQGDCKNAFCNRILPDDKVCIVKPPNGCPHSKPGIYWKLNKTLYELCRSTHHWYTEISNHLTNNLGFASMAQDNCVYKCTLIEGQPPIYVGLYVDNITYYSKCDKVEELFEENLKSHVKADFMGDASWLLLCGALEL